MSDQLVMTNPKPQSYRDLLVWQKGIELAKMLNLITKQLPPDERFGLVTQIRRAAVSIPSNIAEGQARHTTGEFVRFISYAEGSLAELDTQIFLTIELGLITSEQATPSMDLISELRRMLNSLRRKLTGEK